MTRIFLEIASRYDDVRPGYPAEVLDAIADFQGGPASVAELGAGTGKGTELLVRPGVPATCVEPDPRMAAVRTRAALTPGLDAALPASLTLDLRTTLVLARR